MLGPVYAGLTAKWQPDDLVPGLSDIDYRVILSPEATPTDWVVADRACGEIHQQLARENAGWWRILEHTPGCGLTTAELADDQWYTPEYRMWQLCHGDATVLTPMRHFLDCRPWDATDELYHLKRFLLYYSPYQHDIDPPINLGAYETLYGLHSRCWHYFAPPMTSVAALVTRQTLPGKRAAFALLMREFPQVEVVRRVVDMVDQGYKVAERSVEVAMKSFEAALYDAFGYFETVVRQKLQYVDWPAELSPAALKANLAAHATPAAARNQLIDAARFGRIRVGRYVFYLDPPAGFDFERLLRNEGQWANVIARKPFEIGARMLGADLLDADPVAVAENVMNRSLADDEKKSLRQVWAMPEKVRAASNHLADTKEAVARVVDSWEPFYFVLEAYCQTLRGRL